MWLRRVLDDGRQDQTSPTCKGGRGRSLRTQWAVSYLKVVGGDVSVFVLVVEVVQVRVECVRLVEQVDGDVEARDNAHRVTDELGWRRVVATDAVEQRTSFRLLSEHAATPTQTSRRRTRATRCLMPQTRQDSAVCVLSGGPCELSRPDRPTSAFCVGVRPAVAPAVPAPPDTLRRWTHWSGRLSSHRYTRHDKTVLSGVSVWTGRLLWTYSHFHLCQAVDKWQHIATIDVTWRNFLVHSMG